VFTGALHEFARPAIGGPQKNRLGLKTEKVGLENDGPNGRTEKWYDIIKVVTACF